MTFRSPHYRIIAIAVLAMSGSLYAAETKGGAAEKKAAAAASAKQAAAGKAAADVQALLDQFKSRRDSILADRAKLERELKAATEAEKKAILDKIESKQKELLAEQRALGKRIRDDMRKLRRSVAPAGGRP